MSPPTWAYRAADAQAQRGRHGSKCRCLRCIGRDAYVAETRALKADLDARGVAAEPPGWRGVQRRLRR